MRAHTPIRTAQASEDLQIPSATSLSIKHRIREIAFSLGAVGSMDNRYVCRAVCICRCVYVCRGVCGGGGVWWL